MGNGDQDEMIKSGIGRSQVDSSAASSEIICVLAEVESSPYYAFRERLFRCLCVR